MNDITIRPELVVSILHFGKRTFTVAQLTKTYMRHPQCEHASKQQAARQFVYRNMVRMIKVGYMEIAPSTKSWPQYRICDLLLEYAQRHQIPLNTSPFMSTRDNPQNDTHVPHSAKAHLKERLSTYRSEMLCAIGEAEEYNDLCKVHPELSEDAQTLYSESRERSAKLLGKVKALESMLTRSFDRA